MPTRFLFDVPLTGTPIVAVADLFSVSTNPGRNWPTVQSTIVKTVELNLDGAVTTAEKIYIQVKKAEGGAHSGADGASVLTDSTKSWTVDGLIGKRVYNVTDGSYGTITDNDATTVTATLGGGTDDDWDAGDRYLILDAKPLFLQAIEPSLVTDTEFLVVLDECLLFSDEVVEIEFDNTDAVEILAGSNIAYG